MDISLTHTQAVELLSRLTGQKVDKKKLTPPILFMTAVLFVIVGVIHVDGEVSRAEKEKFKLIINSLISGKSKFRQFIQLISKKIITSQLYKDFNNLSALTVGFSEEEKILLICLGFQISIADGEMDIRNKKYLRILAQKLQVKNQYIDILEAVFENKNIQDEKKLNTIRSLLDPARFYSLDKIFVKAASQSLQYFPSKHPKDEVHHLQGNFSDFSRFKEQYKQLKNNCRDLSQLIQEGCSLNIIQKSLLEEVREILAKLESQRFRVAVVGEFSQGKSTLLNAWLGQEIQPVRAIPCSGTITVLKYGTRKRVICRYKNGTEEEIPFEKYQEKCSISEDAAIDSLAEELASSEIQEIVLEHPELLLCKNGVEIVDSPGLNEHPNRSAITQKLIQDTDAIIFLANASRLLTQGERQLLKDLRLQLNNGNKNEPATNIFVVVNFMDLIRTEKDRQGVKQRIEKFVFGQESIIKGDNRIHFISAQSALDSILGNTQDDHLKSFQFFTHSIEQFLVNERGAVAINKNQKLISNLAGAFDSELKQFEQLVTGKFQLSEQNKQEIFDCIGEATGRDVKINLLVNSLVEETMENVSQSWDEWVEGLVERLTVKSETWTSKEEEKGKVMRDYAQQFAKDFSQDFQSHFESKIISDYLEEYVTLLDEEISVHLEAIKNNIESLDLEIGSNLVEQFSLSIANVKQDINLNLSLSKEDSDSGAGWLGWGSGALVAGLLSFFTGGLFLPIALGGVAGGFLGAFFDDDPKQKVLEKGFEKIGESFQDIYDKVCDKIISIFRDRLEVFSEITKQSIAICEQLIEQNEVAHAKVLQSSETSLNWISQKRQYIEKLKLNIKQISR